MRKIITICILVIVFSCKERSPKNHQEVGTNISEKWLTFHGSDAQAQHIVLISGDEEYRSEEALPQLAKILSKRHGFKCTVLFAQDPTKPGIINANYTKHIPGLQALATADMMVIFTRFRALPDAQMQQIDDYLKSGRPVLGIRTATHAFSFPENSDSNFAHYGNGYSGAFDEWTDGFGRMVLGEKWINHHGHHKHQSTRGIIAENAEVNEITNGLISGEIWGSTDVYGVRLPLLENCQAVILGQVINRKGNYNENDIFFGMKPTDDEIATENDKGKKVNDTLMPIAWMRSYEIPGGEQEGLAFTTTIGAASDMLNEGVRRLMVNGIYWAMELPVPREANVELVGDYEPSSYGFKTDEYWIKKQMKITSLKD